MDSLLGRVLCGKYRIEKLLGRGGMGAVYTAVHLALEKPVAVKTLLPRVAEVEEAYQRFLREARAASRLRHPHIIEVSDFDHADDGMPFMVMELLDGEDLGQRLEREGRLSVATLGRIARDVCSAIQAAHDGQIVHRDLKPQNIFLGRYGEHNDFVKVLDFGISKLRFAGSALTNTEAFLGTPNYMAPEQAMGQASSADARTDVFALGAILYRALAGQDAFCGDSIHSVLYKIVHEEPVPLRELAGDLPEPVVQVVTRALSKAPEQRYANAGELRVAFCRAANVAITEEVELLPYAPTGASGPGAELPAAYSSTLSGSAAELVVPPAPSSGRRRRRLVVAAGALALAGVLGGAAMLMQRTASNEPGEPAPARATAAAGRKRPEAAAAPAAAPSRTTPPAKSAEAAPLPAKAARVRIRIEHLPADAVVTVDGKRVDGNPFELPRATAPVRLRVRASRGVVTRALTPDGDRTIALQWPGEQRGDERRREPARPRRESVPAARSGPAKPAARKRDVRARQRRKHYGESTMPF